MCWLTIATPLSPAQVLNLCMIFLPVTGEANFSMETTSLTVGGFSHPGVARTLIEQPGSIETGLTQRFLWSFPKPSYARFGTLEAVDEHFTELLGSYQYKGTSLHLVTMSLLFTWTLLILILQSNISQSSGNLTRLIILSHWCSQSTHSLRSSYPSLTKFKMSLKPWPQWMSSYHVIAISDYL